MWYNFRKIMFMSAGSLLLLTVSLWLLGLPAPAAHRAALASSAAPTAPISTLPPQAILEISSTVRLTGTKRLGMNLGSHNQFGAAQLLKNVIRNPGFEAGEYGMIFLALSNTSSSRVQASLWNTVWNHDPARVGQPVGFWNGADYEIVTGPAAGRSGTITNFTHENNRYTFYLSGAGPAPAEGNVLIVRRSVPGYYGDPQPFYSADSDNIRPGSPGTQSLRLTAPVSNIQSACPDPTGQPAWCYMMDSLWQRDPSSGKLVIADGAWHFEIWARAQRVGEPLTVRFRRQELPNQPNQDAPIFFQETIALSTTWQHIVRDFTVPIDGDPIRPLDPITDETVLLLSLHLTPNSGDVWVDDITLERSGQSTLTVFTDKVVARLQELKPGILRNWGQQQLGSTLDNQLAVPWARRTNHYGPEQRTATNYHYSIHEFLQLAALIDAEPWYVIPPSFSPTDLQNLVAYLAAEPGAHPYADHRASLGQAAPWTTRFTMIHLEYGNEMWGGIISQTNPFLGASVGGLPIGGVSGGARLGRVADNRFAIMRSSPFFDADKLNLIIGSRAAGPQTTQQIETNSTHHDTVALAPYFYQGNEITATASAAEIFYPLFAWPRQDVRTTGRVAAAQEHLLTATQGTEMAIYEINFHTTRPGVPIDVRNDFVTSLGGGLALPLFMLTYQQELGIRHQNVWQVASFSNPVDGASDEYVRLFGALRDLEATGRKRPTWLGVELANRAIGADLLRTNFTGTLPIWVQTALNGINSTIELPLLQAFAYRDGNEYAVMLFNLDLTSSHVLQLRLPGPPQATATLHTLSASSVYSNNEESEQVQISTTPINDFAQDYQLTLAPHSAYVLAWQGVGIKPALYLSVVRN